MSNWNQYRKLWQQKRDELHVDSNAQADWSEMHNLLDQLMPVTPAPPTPPSPKVPKSVFSKFGPLLVMTSVIIAGLVTYFVARTNQDIATNKKHKPNHTEIRKDSTAVNEVVALSDLLQNITGETTNNAQADKQPNAITGTAKTEVDKADNTTASNADNKANTLSNKNIATANNRTSHTQTATNNLSGANSAGNHYRLINSDNSVASKYNSGSSRRVNSVVKISQNDDWKAGIHNQQDDKRYNNSAIANNPTETSKNSFTEAASLYLSWDDVIKGTSYPATLPYFSVDVQRTAASQTSTDSKKSKDAKKSADTKKSKDKKPKSSGNAADIDWGLLIGANTNGSFTGKEFNHNLYGGLGTDPYLGLFATGNINERWSATLQIKALVPHMAKGSYEHKNESQVDLGQTFQFQDLRKVYTVDMPVLVAYHLGQNFNLKAGPYVSLPLKQFGGIVGYEKGPQRDNSGYYTSVDKLLESTDISKKVQFGLSGGAGVTYHCLSLDATYNYQLQSQKVSSPLGGYATHMNNLQITLGIQLNKSKK